MDAGYVYLMHREDGLYKIGFSGDPAARARQVADIVGMRVALLAKVPTDDPRGLERAAHFQYADRRIEGEWFRFAEDEIEGVRMTIAKLVPIPAPSQADRALDVQVKFQTDAETKEKLTRAVGALGMAGVHIGGYGGLLNEMIDTALGPFIEQKLRAAGLDEKRVAAYLRELRAQP